jgi:hypothetical protein
MPFTTQPQIYDTVFIIKRNPKIKLKSLINDMLIELQKMRTFSSTMSQLGK